MKNIQQLQKPARLINGVFVFDVKIPTAAAINFLVCQKNCWTRRQILIFDMTLINRRPTTTTHCSIISVHTPYWEMNALGGAEIEIAFNIPDPLSDPKFSLRLRVSSSPMEK